MVPCLKEAVLTAIAWFNLLFYTPKFFVFFSPILAMCTIVKFGLSKGMTFFFFFFTISILSKFYSKKNLKMGAGGGTKMSVKSNHHYNIQLDRKIEDLIQLTLAYFPK